MRSAWLRLVSWLVKFTLTSCIILPKRPHFPNGAAIICPPGFVMLEKRAHCIRVFVTREPKDFDTAAWACGAYPRGELAQMKQTDDKYLRILTHYPPIGSTNVSSRLRRVWVGIRRWSKHAPFVYTATNLSVEQSGFVISTDREPNQDIDRGDCVYWDFAEERLMVTACQNNRSVYSFVCQSGFEFYPLCDTKLVSKSSCSAKRLLEFEQRNETETCWRITTKRVMGYPLPCAINQSCVVRERISTREGRTFGNSAHQCIVNCAGDYSADPKQIPCNRIYFDVVERCECSSDNKKSGACSSDENESRASYSNGYKTFIIAACLVSCLVILAIIGFISWRKYTANGKPDDPLLEVMALE